MKIQHLAILATMILGLPTFTSCISDEPLNQECDIENISINLSDDEILHYFQKFSDANIDVDPGSDNVCFEAREDVTIGKFPISLKVTPGAQTYYNGQPFVNGSSLDFSGEQKHVFHIVSEDGKWSRDYHVFAINTEDVIMEDDALTFHFESDCYGLNPSGADKDKYYVWRAEGEAAKVWRDEHWKNGNPGYFISQSKAKPLDFPTCPVLGGGPDGSDCVKMETRDTGTFGMMARMPIASGSFFNGNFVVTDAISNALAATRFGSTFMHKPLSATVWMKYEPGPTFTDRQKKPVGGIIDEPDFYIIMFRNTDASGKEIMLDGSNVLTSPNIVGMARLPHRGTPGNDQLTDQPIHGITAEWQKVKITMQYSEPIDQKLLKDGGYSIICGFASSWQGAYFQGAIGSKLWIDNLSIQCEHEDDPND